MVNEREFGVSLLEANISDSEEEDGSNTLQARLDNIPPSVGEWGFTTIPQVQLLRLDACRGNRYSDSSGDWWATGYITKLVTDMNPDVMELAECFISSFMAHDLIPHCYALWFSQKSTVLLFFPCRPPDESAGVCVCSHLLDHCAAEGSSQKRFLLHSRPVQAGIPAGVWHRWDCTVNSFSPINIGQHNMRQLIHFSLK